MTTAKEAARLKEAYRLALSAGDVARYRDRFRYGHIVYFKISEEFGFSDGLAVPDRVDLAGSFQLRYGPSNRPDGKSDRYCVYGRLGPNAAWVPVDGPWKVGEGPFDGR